MSRLVYRPRGEPPRIKFLFGPCGVNLQESPSIHIATGLSSGFGHPRYVNGFGDGGGVQGPQHQLKTVPGLPFTTETADERACVALLVVLHYRLLYATKNNIPKKRNRRAHLQRVLRINYSPGHPRWSYVYVDTPHFFFVLKGLSDPSKSSLDMGGKVDSSEPLAGGAGNLAAFNFFRAWNCEGSKNDGMAPGPASAAEVVASGTGAAEGAAAAAAGVRRRGESWR